MGRGTGETVVAKRSNVHLLSDADRQGIRETAQTCASEFRAAKQARHHASLLRAQLGSGAKHHAQFGTALNFKFSGASNDSSLKAAASNDSASKASHDSESLVYDSSVGLTAF